MQHEFSWSTAFGAWTGPLKNARSPDQWHAIVLLQVYGLTETAVRAHFDRRVVCGASQEEDDEQEAEVEERQTSKKSSAEEEEEAVAARPPPMARPQGTMPGNSMMAELAARQAAKKAA